MELAPAVRRDMQTLAQFAQSGADRQAQIDRVVEFATGRLGDAAALSTVSRETGLTPAQILRVVAHYHEDMVAQNPSQAAVALTGGATGAKASHGARPAGHTLALKGFTAPLPPKADVATLWAEYEKTQTVSAELAARFIEAVVRDGSIDLAELNKLREMTQASGDSHSPVGKRLVELLLKRAEATFEARSQRLFSFILGPRKLDAVNVTSTDIYYSLDTLGTRQSGDALKALLLSQHPIDKDDAAQAQRFQRFVEDVQGGKMSVYGAMVELDTFSTPERVMLGLEAVVRQVRNRDDVDALMRRAGWADEPGPFRLTSDHLLTMVTNPGAEVEEISNAFTRDYSRYGYSEGFSQVILAALKAAEPQDVQAMLQAKSVMRHALETKLGPEVAQLLSSTPGVTVAQRAELFSGIHQAWWNIRPEIDKLLVEAETQQDLNAIASLAPVVLRARRGENLSTRAADLLRALIKRGVSAEAVFKQVEHLAEMSAEARRFGRGIPFKFDVMADVLGDLAARGDLSASASRRIAALLYHGADPQSTVHLASQHRAMVFEKLLSRGAELPAPHSEDGQLLSRLILSFPFEEQQTFESLYQGATYRYGTLVGQHLPAISAAIANGQSSLLLTLDTETFQQVAGGDEALAVASMQAHLQRLYRDHRPQVKVTEQGDSQMRLEVTFHPLPRHETKVTVNVSNATHLNLETPGTFFGWLSGTNPKRRKG